MKKKAPLIGSTIRERDKKITEYYVGDYLPYLQCIELTSLWPGTDIFGQNTTFMHSMSTLITLVPW